LRRGIRIFISSLFVLSIILVAVPVSNVQALPPETQYAAYNTNLTGDDNVSGNFNIGFNFTYYGNTYSQFQVTTNGLLCFNGQATNQWTENPIPTTATPNNCIYPFWDDLESYNVTTQPILYLTIGTAPNRELIVQWTNYGYFNSSLPMGTFQAILYEGSNAIRTQYRQLLTDPRSFGNSATIGVENSTGTVGTQYSYDTSSLTEGQSILWTWGGSNYSYNALASYEGVYLYIGTPPPAIPTLVAPSDGAAGVGTSPTFQWNAASNATSYRLIVSVNSNLNSPTVDVSGITGTSYTTSLSSGTYYWAVVAHNSAGDSWSESWQFQTQPGNSAPNDISLSSSTIAAGQPSGTTVGTLSTSDPDVGNTFTYTLVSGPGSTNNGSFQISSNQLLTNAVLAAGSYTVRVRSTDQGGLYYEKAFTITASSTNRAPTDISLSPSSVAENQPANTTVGALTTTDPDAGDTFTYTLVSGTGSTDNASFNISGSSLRTSTSFDYETKNSYSVRVRSTDSGGLYFEKALTVTVTNVNETPTDINLSNSSVAENQPSGTTVGALTTTDPDSGNTFTYTLVIGTGSTDNASFNISGGSLRTSASFDYETKSSYSIRIRSTDQGGLYYEKVFTIMVTDVNETPTNISLSNSSVTENRPANTTVGSFSTTDPDTGNTFTYTLVTGTGSDDNGSFNISGGSLLTSASFDYETKSSYSIRVRSTDQGGLYTEKAFTISIADVNEAPTDINLSNNSVAENSAVNTTVGSLSSIDPDSGNTFTYALVSGTGSDDNGSFNISGSSLRTSASFDYETKNSYTVRVRSTDQGGLYTEKVFTVSVTDVNETPTDISLSNSNVDENQPGNTVIGSLGTADPDAGDTFTYTLVSGTGSDDNGSFNISSDSLRTSASFDYETRNSYTIRVRSTDSGGLYTEKAFTIIVNDVNEAPTDIDLDNNSVAENLPANTFVGNLSSADPDAGNTFTYTLVAGTSSGDNGSFNISGGSLLTSASFDYETKNNYSIRVRSTDQDGLYFDKEFTITVIDVNETPTAINLSNASVDENKPANTVVGDLSTIDPDAGDTFTYTLVSGSGSADNDSFNISDSSLHTSDSFDYETQNSYTVRVRSTDSGGLWTEQAFTITVNDVNEAPEVDAHTFSVAENSANGTFVGTATANDQDTGDSFTFGLTAGNELGVFAIDPATGMITVADNTNLNYEANPTFHLTVTATDSHGLPGSNTVTVNLIDVGEAPTDINLSSTVVAENQPTDTVVGTLSASDPDAGETFTYSLVSGTGSTDNGDFNISGDQLRTGMSFDYEVKNSYQIRVQVTDKDGLTYQKPFTITVTDVNDAPKFTSKAATVGYKDIPYEYSIVARDEDFGDILTLTAPTLPVWLQFVDNGNGTGVLSGKPEDANIGKNPVSLVVTDSHGATATQNFVISVAANHVGGTASSNGGSISCTPWSVLIDQGVFPTATQVLCENDQTAEPDPVAGINRLNQGIKITLMQGETELTSVPYGVQVCYHYTSDFLAKVGGNPYNLRIGTYESGSTGWQIIQSTVDAGDSLICGEVTHFSWFELLQPELPSTGFAPGVQTVLPVQSSTQADTQEIGLTLDIPNLKVDVPITGVPLTDHGWDLTWLGNEAGYLDGTAFPTWSGNSVITGHVYLANGKPGPFVDLNQLQWGDQIIVHTSWGQDYTYEVRAIKEVAPDDLSILDHKDQSWLTLVTCQGYDQKTNSYQQRLVVRAVLVSIK
jgi:LPXTG-site transpeptidase (sortase) family protein